MKCSSGKEPGPVRRILPLIVLASRLLGEGVAVRVRNREGIMKLRKILNGFADITIANLAFIIIVISVNYQSLSTALFINLIVGVIFQMVIYYCVFRIFRVYQCIWRYARVKQYLNLVLACMVAGLIFTVISYIVIQIEDIFFIGLTSTAYSGILIVCGRMGYSYYHRNSDEINVDEARKRNRTLIVGAGFTAANILIELQEKNSQFYPVCFVDDDKSKVGRELNDIPVLGTTYDIPRICREHKIKSIIFAIPSCDKENKKRILNICADTKCELRVLPYMSQLVDDAKLVSQMKEVRIEDLLGRDEINLDNTEVYRYTTGKVCLVTGGGGSIGSELCRQLAASRPKKLIILDSYENGAYEIQQELKRIYGSSLDLTVEIFSVADRERLDAFYAEFKPQLVFHAAAHKHVPLMETNPEQAVKNNVVGTFNAASLAAKHGVERFLLISTDKAVNPTNVMGATKRVCELILNYMTQQHTSTSFVAVRFGNVLGSNGSAIPLFKRQIEAGGPVTVTHPDIIRYFMTISEAVSLVLRAGTMAKGGELFVLDMGEQVRILTLVENLIKLSGFTPYEEIPIVFTGLRPGEKLYEELLIAEDGVEKTESQKIFITHQSEIQPEEFRGKLDRLIEVASQNDVPAVLQQLKAIVPTFHHEVNRG